MVCIYIYIYIFQSTFFWDIFFNKTMLIKYNDINSILDIYLYYYNYIR